ncbi:hypothetical protein V6N13_007843 [Hibiscus sabdariffa]
MGLYSQPLCEPKRLGRTVANGYMQWFYNNGKPFILSPEECARVIPGLVQSDHDNNVVVILPMPLLRVAKGHEQHRFLWWTSASIRGPIYRACDTDPSGFQPLIQFIILFYYGTFDGMIFR